MRNRGFGVYIHIPFCQQKCFYCDFPSFAGREKYIAPYVRALKHEIKLAAEKYKVKGKTPATIYIGGGTPSYLPADILKELLQAIKDNFSSDEKVEFSIEANPGSLTEEKLAVMLQGGINRLSIGVQSFDDTLLKKMGRIHSSKDAKTAVEMARKAGISNISVDIIYGLPGETLEQVKADVAAVLSLGVEHISVYGLQVEDGTVFSRLQEQNRLDLPSEDTVEAMYDYIMDTLPKAGYFRYEISNFAKKRFESKHNLSYWNDVPYLGLGAGAHSYCEGIRFYNWPDLKWYVNTVDNEFLPWDLENAPSMEEHKEEFCFLALRTAKGINRKKYMNTFYGEDVEEKFGRQISALQKQGLIIVDDIGVRLTPLGMKVGNKVFAEFILDD